MAKILAILMSLQLMVAPVAMAQSAGDQFRENPNAKAGGMDLYAKQILAISTSAIGTNILTSCKLGAMLMSMKVYMAGSVVYIASEILGGKAANENYKKRASDLKMVEEKMKNTQGGDVQKEALEQALKEEKETLSFINKRKMWLMAVTAIYAAATGFAVMEMMKSRMCMNITAAASPATLAMCNTPPYPTASGLCGPDLKSGLLAKLLPAAFGIMAAQTGGGGISTYAGYALALGQTIGKLGTFIQKAYETPMARVITFGASTVLVGLVMKGLMDRAKVTKENISKLEKVIANFDSGTQPSNALGSTTPAVDQANNTSGGQITALGNGNSNAINTLADGSTLPRHCFSNTPQGMNYSPDSCKAPARMPGMGFDGSLSVPTLASAANLAGDTAQAVANGNIGSAETSAAQLASMAGTMRKITDNMTKQLNDQLKKEGKPALDVDGEVNKQVQGMIADFNKQNGTNLAASGFSSQGLDPLKDLEKKDNTSINTASAGPAIDLPSAAGGTFTEGLVNEPSLANDVPAVDPNADYEYNEKDISDRNDVSLFEQLSNRYLFQYKKFFSEEGPREDTVK